MNLSSRNLIVLFLLLPILVLAQEETTTEIPNEYPKRSYTTASISNATPIAIDGNINEEAWDAVEWTTDYVEFEPTCMLHLFVMNQTLVISNVDWDAVMIFRGIG